MAKYAICIEPSTDDYYWIDDMWKQYVDGEDFDEDVVILGDRDHSGIEEASWWSDVKELLEYFTNGYTPSDIGGHYNIHKLEAGILFI